MREDTKKMLEQVGLIPVLRCGSIQTGHALVDAMMAGGVTVVEVTMTVPNALQLLRELKQRHGEKLLLGSGTVTDAAQVEAAIAPYRDQAGLRWTRTEANLKSCQNLPGSSIQIISN